LSLNALSDALALVILRLNEIRQFDFWPSFEEKAKPSANVSSATVLGATPDFSEVEGVAIRLMLLAHGVIALFHGGINIESQCRDVFLQSGKWLRFCFKIVSWSSMNQQLLGLEDLIFA
jgi:hypothetical protein